MQNEVPIGNRQWEAVFEQAPVGMAILESAQSRYVKVNRRFCDILGYSAKELMRRSIQDITHPDDLDMDLEQVGRISDGSAGEFSCEKCFRKKDGAVVWTRVSVAPFESREGGPALRLEVIEDITHIKRMESEKKFRELSIVDDLTQLYNSRQFSTQLKMESDRSNRYHQPLTLLMLDIDNFKVFNDNYGHVEGDRVLRRLGKVVKRCLRKTDYAYRYGGEEFTFLLPMTTIAEGSVTAERIRTEFKKEIFSPAQDREVHMTVSIGVAQYRANEDMKAFVRRADQLMYQAKENGKDRIFCEAGEKT